MEVINALMRNTIDVKRASLIIRALHIAVKNAARVKFGIHAKDTVTQVPEYTAPTPEHEVIAQQSELPAVSAIPYKPVEPHDRHFWEYQEEGGRVLAREAQARRAAEQAHVGAPAIGTPAQAKPGQGAGTDALVHPGREATVPTPASDPTVSVAHDFKKTQPVPQQKALPKSQSAPQQTALHRKPPATAKPVPQERKNAAHGASRG